MITFYLENAILLIVGFAAIRFGGPPERHGAIWLLANCLFQAVLTGCRVSDTTIYLIADGIYATGLIPLAYFYMSRWIGAMAFLVCASFSLQSYYLVSDQQADGRFAHLFNLVTDVQVATYLVATIASYLHRRRLGEGSAIGAVAAPAA